MEMKVDKKKNNIKKKKNDKNSEIVRNLIIEKK
jgi:hypothetical protein